MTVMSGMILLWVVAQEPLPIEEFLIDTAAVYQPVSRAQESPAIARGAGNCLAVWADERDSSRIYGCRIDTTGQVLDPGGVRLSFSAAIQRSPAVAFGSNEFLVVWHDYRNGRADIYATRVDTSGRVLDSAGVVVAYVGGEQRYPAVAFDGVNFAVTWQDGRYSDTSPDIYAARVSTSGFVLDPNGIPVSVAPGPQWLPQISFDGSNCLIVWQDRRNSTWYDIYGARVDQSGFVLDPAGFMISHAPNSQRHPKLASGGTNSLVVWYDRRNGAFADIYGARVTPQAQVLDPAGIPICVDPAEQQLSSVAFDGNNFFVTWEDWRSGDSADIYGARVNQSGVVLDTAGIAVSLATNAQTAPALAFDGSNYVCLWQDKRDGLVDHCYYTRVTPFGQILNPEGIPLLAQQANDQTEPCVAKNGGDWLVIWQDSRPNPGIYALRLNSSGSAIDSVAFPVTIQQSQEQKPAAAAGDSSCLVVWQDERNGNRDVYGARVDYQGRVLDSIGLAISRAPDTEQAPRVAWDGAHWLAVWEAGRSSGNYAIYGARIDRSGVLLDSAGIPISAGAYDHRAPAVTFNGHDFLVVWEDWRSNLSYKVYGARVNPQGVLLDTTGIAIATGDFYQEQPAVASGEDNWLVAWEDERGADKDIYGARVSAGGVLLDSGGIAIASGTGSAQHVALAVTNHNYVTVWENQGDVWGAHVDFGGTVTDRFPIALGPETQQTPEIAGGAEEAWAVYSGWAGVVHGHRYGSMRIWGARLPWAGIAEPVLTPAADRLPLTAAPNPFRTQVTVRLPLTASQRALTSLRVYDAAGRLVRRLSVSCLQPSACASLVWDGTDESGRQVPAGVYHCCLEVAGRMRTGTRLVRSY